MWAVASIYDFPQDKPCHCRQVMKNIHFKSHSSHACTKILATVVVVSPVDCVHDSPLIMDMVINSLIVETHDQRKLLFSQGIC